MFLKNKFIIIIFSVILFSILLLSILGIIPRVGYISEFTQNDIKNNHYLYNFRIKYYNNVFRNSDIYSVYIKNIDNILEINNFIKEIKMEKGSPFGTLISSKQLEYNDKIDIDYYLYIRPIIFLVFISSFIFIFIFYHYKNNIFKYIKILLHSRYFSILFSLFISSLLIFIFLPIVNKIPIKYPDFYFSITESSEVFNEYYFRLLLFLISSLLLIIIEFCNRKNIYVEQGGNNNYLMIMIPILMYILFFQIIEIFSTGIILFTIIFYKRNNRKFIYYPIIAFIFLYAFNSIFAILNIFGLVNTLQIGSLNLELISLFSSALYFYYLDNKSHTEILKTIQKLQIIIPFYILIFFKYKYRYNNEIISFFKEHLLFNVFILSILFMLFILNIFILFINNNKIKSIKKSITLPTILSVAIGNIYGCKMFAGVGELIPRVFVPFDWWHYGDETAMGFSFFIANQIPFKDFYPISGLFAILNGFFQNVIFQNIITNAYFSNILLIIFISIITYILIYKYTNSIFALFIAHYVFLFSYSRTYLIIPIILILSFTKLIKNRGIWLALWVFLIFLQGLYYPSYGGFMLLATLPFGIIQLYLYFKEKKILEDIKNPKFYLIWILILIPIIISIPMLINIAEYILVQSSQTIFVDGIKLYGKEAPTWLLPIVNNQFIKNNIYYCIRIMIPIIATLLFIHTFITFLFKNIKVGLYKKLDSPVMLILSFSIIFLIISSTQTFVRQDVNTLASRSKFIILYLSSILIPGVLLFHSAKLINNKYKYLISYIAISVGMLVNIDNNMNINNNINIYSNIIEVPKEMVLIDDNTKKISSNIGNGFILTGHKNYIESGLKKLKEISDDETSILSYNNTFEPQILNKAFYFMEVASFAYSKSFIEFIQNRLDEKSPDIIFSMPSGVYCWAANKDYRILPEYGAIFMKPDYFQKVVGEFKAENSISNINLYGAYISQSTIEKLGYSIDNLKSQFTNEYYLLDNFSNLTNVNYIEFTLDRKITGTNFDYLFIELPEDLYFDNALIYWKGIDEEYKENKVIGFQYGKYNKYLIPIGYFNTWRFNNTPEKIKIVFNDVNRELEINKCILYKRDMP